MKVALVYPGISSLGFDSFGIGAEGSWINHGLCSISASAKRAGHAVELIDLRRLKGWRDFRAAVRMKRPDVVGVTMMSVDFDPALRCLALVKEDFPGMVTVAGGPHPSIMPEELTGIGYIDHIVRGEGEISFIGLLDDLARGVRPAAKVITGEPADLDELPFADRELFNATEQPWLLTDKRPFVTVIAGRGCIYNCSFCQPAERLIFGKKVRRRSVDNVLRELHAIREKLQFRSFMFHDDCLIENQEWIREFCRKYAEQGFSQEFVCQGRADIVCKHPGLIAEMRKAGLVGMIIGFESGSQRVLNFLRKGVTVEQNYRAAQICRELNIKIQANYMLGIPTETNEEALETLRMIEVMRPAVHGHSVYTPAPGSDLFAYCKQNDLLLMKTHNDYRRDAYTTNKIKGIDYVFLAAAAERMRCRNIPFARRVLGRIIQYVSRENRFTLQVLKKVLKVSILRQLAHRVLSAL
jgi:radical SAM superfamily enzyme YgiQ (UPF0313 family)